jgi:hypothetical protein
MRIVEYYNFTYYLRDDPMHGLQDNRKNLRRLWT